MPPGAESGPLGIAVSHWFLVVQGGAVVVAIILAWVVGRLWSENQGLHLNAEDLLKDRIKEARQDTETERATTKALTEEITRGRKADEDVAKRLEAVEGRMEDLERKVQKG